MDSQTLIGLKLFGKAKYPDFVTCLSVNEAIKDGDPLQCSVEYSAKTAEFLDYLHGNTQNENYP